MKPSKTRPKRKWTYDRIQHWVRCRLSSKYKEESRQRTIELIKLLEESRHRIVEKVDETIAKLRRDYQIACEERYSYQLLTKYEYYINKFTTIQRGLLKKDTDKETAEKDAVFALTMLMEDSALVAMHKAVGMQVPKGFQELIDATKKGKI